MKRILINATHPEEIRVAHMQESNLVDFDVESLGQESNKGCIYKGRVTAVQRDLEGAFVDIGMPRHGLLPLKRVVPQLFPDGTESDSVDIDNVLNENQELLVQIEKEARGDKKGPSLTTEISIPGRYIVLKPNRPTGGVSTAVSEKERQFLRTTASKLKVPHGMGWIIRTSARDRTLEEIQEDLDSQLELYERIEAANENEDIRAPRLIYQENTLIERILRDKLRGDVAQVIIDDDKVYEESKQFVDNLMPELADRIKKHTSSQPIFTHYRVESKIKSLFDRELHLPSGGRIVIDPTEALTAVDVNSARATQANTLGDTALTTNLEAATEVARQLVLRNIGGLVVVDFIDMQDPSGKKKVEDRMANLLETDRANTSWQPISMFGLMEIQRQRVKRAIHDTEFEECEHCESGSVRNTQSIALEILREVEVRAAQDQIRHVTAHVPVEAANFILNEKRDFISVLEQRFKLAVVIVPCPEFSATTYEVKGFRKSRDAEQSRQPLRAAAQKVIKEPEERHKIEKPVVSRLATGSKEEKAKTKRARTKPKQAKVGLLRRAWSSLTGKSEPAKSKSRGKQQPRQKQTKSRGKSVNSRTPQRSAERGQRIERTAKKAADSRSGSTRGQPREQQAGRGRESKGTANRSQPSRAPRSTERQPRQAQNQRQQPKRRSRQGQGQASSQEPMQKQAANADSRVASRGERQQAEGRSGSQRNRSRPRRGRRREESNEQHVEGGNSNQSVAELLSKWDDEGEMTLSDASGESAAGQDAVREPQPRVVRKQRRNVVDNTQVAEDVAEKTDRAAAPQQLNEGTAEITAASSTTAVVEEIEVTSEETPLQRAGNDPRKRSVESPTRVVSNDSPETRRKEQPQQRQEETVGSDIGESREQPNLELSAPSENEGAPVIPAPDSGEPNRAANDPRQNR